MMRLRLGRWIIGTLLLFGLWQVFQGSWIYLKAELAQWLLQDAWRRGGAAGHPSKPWPWADTVPLLRLQVPRLQVDAIVLAGDHGQALAFGPGHADASATPGRPGTALISGHRDTHFRFMRELRVGDRILIGLLSGRQLEYRVTGAEVVNADRIRIAAETEEQLLLATCWPFDSPIPGGPLRYVAVAEPVSPAPVEVDKPVTTTALIIRKTDKIDTSA